MGLDRQLEELCSVYAERSDAELLSLHEQRDDLTDLAQQALAQVMKERRLSASGVPVASAVATPAMGARSVLRGDEVEVTTFHDAFQANEALRVLGQAEIEHRMVDWNESAPPTSGPTYLRLGLVVHQPEVLRAREVLQHAMKLFPAAEGADGDEGDGAFDPYDERAAVTLGVFHRQDALLIAHALGSAGVSYIWTDGQEDERGSPDAVEIEVNGPRLERARQLVEQALSQPNE